MAVAVVALVSTGDPAEEGSRAIGGDGSLLDPGDSRSVVGEVADGGVGRVVGCGLDFELGYQARMFQVTVGDAAGRVVRGHQAGLHVGTEWYTPQKRATRVVPEDTPHPRLGGIGGSH